MTMTSICAILVAALTLRLHTIAAAPPHPKKTSSIAARRLDTPQDGNLKFNDATFITSHNAHANLAVAEGFLGPLGANQDDSIIDQLTNDGVRALMLDIMLNFDEYPEEPLRLVHGSSFIMLDYGGLRTALGSNLVPFLEENEDAVISLFIEPQGDVGQDQATVRATILNQLKSMFASMTVNGVSLKDMTFKYDHELWKDHEDWPKLDEIRQSGQRIFVFTSRSEFINTAYGFMHNRQVLQENDWEGIDACEARYMWRSAQVSLASNDYWTRLFFMNHFCCGSGPEAKGDTVGLGLIGGGNNGWGSLYPRVQQCMLNNGGFKPNFIALDWVTQSTEAKEILAYLNFGGRLGTGQTCTEDSHCATSSCSTALGICQCQQCPSDRVTICLGCVSGQYCAPPSRDGMTTCLYKEGGIELISQEDLPSQNPSGITPTLSPTATAPITNQYCGTDWDTAVATCYDAVKCPGGNDDCPEGQVCFANLDDCPDAPTLSPSHKPSYFPSLRPIVGGALTKPLPIGSGAATTASYSFCGTDFFTARDNCRSAVPCPEGSNQCSHLGPSYTCFSIGGCVSDSGNGPSPTSPGDSWLAGLGLTSPPTNVPTSAAPISLTPTKAPFDPSNLNYCGGNFTDAEDNCYYRKPCPTGSPTICGGDTCYTGITCTAPPSKSPTSSPTVRPTPPSVLNNGSPGSQNTGNQLQGDQSPGNQPQSDRSQSDGDQSVEPFDIDAYENQSSGVAKSANKLMTGKLVQSISAAIGFLGLLV